jgi:hypothetical protein
MRAGGSRQEATSRRHEAKGRRPREGMMRLRQEATRKMHDPGNDDDDDDPLFICDP